MSESMDVVWYRPNKPANISVGRHQIADHLAERGIDVTLKNASISSIGEVARTSYDAVLGTTRSGAGIGALEKLVSDTPFVVDHIDPIAQFRRTHGRLAASGVAQLESLIFRVADHIMVVYEEELPRVSQYATEYTKTNLGVEYDRFANPDSRSLEKAHRKLEAVSDPDRNRLIYIGGLEPIYNIETMVEAIHHLESWELNVLGDGSQRSYIESLDGRINYLGTVSHEQIPGFLHASDVGISLVDDRNTLKVLEYGAAGLPAVNLRGSAEQRFGDMITYSSLDPRDVAQAVETAHSDGASKELQMFCRQFSWERITDQYETALKTVVSGQ